MHFRLLGTHGFHVKAKNERFTAASSRCRQNLKYENFTSSFGRLRQNFAPKSVPHVQHDYFSSFSQSNNWFVALSLTLPSSNLKRPIWFRFWVYFILEICWLDMFVFRVLCHETHLVPMKYSLFERSLKCCCRYNWEVLDKVSTKSFQLSITGMNPKLMRAPGTIKGGKILFRWYLVSLRLKTSLFWRQHRLIYIISSIGEPNKPCG